jgi:hypothetical protein
VRHALATCIRAPGIAFGLLWVGLSFATVVPWLVLANWVERPR